MAGSLVKVGIGKEDCTVQGDASYPGTFSRQGSLAVLTGLTEMPNMWLTHTTPINARYFNDGAFTDETIQAAIDYVTTDDVVIYLESGTWVLSTSIVGTDNIYFQFAPGALIQPAVGITFTAYSPEHIIAGKRQQIADLTNNSTNPLLFTIGGIVHPGWTGALGDAATDDYAAVNALTQAGNTMEFPYGNYVIKTTWTIAINTFNITGETGRRPTITNSVAGAASDCIEFTTSDPDGAAVFGSGCSIRNILITASDDNMTGGAALKVVKHSGFSCTNIVTLKHPYGIDLHGVRNSDFSDFYLYHTGSTTVNSSALLRIDGMLNDDASYSIPWTTTFGDFHIGCGDTVDYAILILHADGLHFSNAYIAGAHEDIIRIAPDVALNTAVNCQFDNVFLDPTLFSDHDFYIDSTTASVQGILINNVFFGASDIYGLIITGGLTTDVLVNNSKFQNIDLAGITVDDASLRLQVSNCAFVNCRTDADSGAAVYLANANVAIVSNSVFHNAAPVAAWGIIADGTYNKVILSGNSFEGFTGGDIGATGTFTDGFQALGNITDDADGINNTTSIQKIVSLADEATPSVRFGRYFKTSGTANDPITDFDDGINGQVITIIAEHECIVNDATNIFLSGSAAWTMTATDTLTLICKADNKWYEIARSDSGA